MSTVLNILNFVLGGTCHHSGLAVGDSGQYYADFYYH